MKQETVKQNKTKQEIAVTATATQALSVNLASFNDEFADEQRDFTDIKIAKVLLMQAGSDLVKLLKKFKAGDLVRSTDSTLLAAEGTPVRIVVIKKWKSWRIMELVGKKYEWRREELLTPANADAPWDYTEDSKTMRRDKTLNFYAILESEVKAGNAFPIKLSFTRGTIKAGELLADSWERHLAYKKSPYETAFKISSELYTNKKNGETYNIFKVEADGESSEDLRKQASFFRNLTKTQKIAEDQPAETEDAVTAKSTDEF